MRLPYQVLKAKLPPFFHRLGLAVALNPLVTIFAVSVVTFGLMGGIFLTDLDNGYENWYPHKSVAWNHYSYQKTHYGRNNRTEMFIVESEPAALNDMLGVLHKTTLVETMALHNEIAGLPSFQSLCVKAAGGDGQCAPSQSILALWNYDAAALSAASQEDILATVQAGAPGVALDAFLGEVTRDSDGKITGGYALQVIMSVHELLSKETEFLAFEEDEFLPTCRDKADDAAALGFSVYCQAARSYSDESDRAVAEDQNLMMFAMILMIGYVALVLSRRDPVESKILLGLTIIICVGLSLGVAFGICGYAGIPFTQMSMMTIFIIMGVGIDDMFIITDAFAREPASLPQQERVANALAEVGSSITLTSVTDFLAFTIGSFIDLPAVSFFCTTAAIAVIAVFFIQVTFFAACLSIDARRLDAKRYDLLPCLVRPIWDERKEEGDAPAAAAAAAAYDPDPEPRKSGFCVNFSAWLATPMVARGVVLFFAVEGFAMAYHGLTTIGKGINVSDFLPTGSYVEEYFSKRDIYFGEVDQIEFITTKVIDVGKAADRDRLADLTASVDAMEQTVGTCDCWFSSWQQYHAGVNGAALDSATSYSDARASFDGFKLTDAFVGHYAASVVFQEVDGVELISTSKCSSLFLFSSQDTDKAVGEMDEAREAAAKDDGFAFAFNANYLWMERYRTIDKLTLTTMVGAIFGVLVIALFFLDPVTAVLVAVCVIMINLNLLGMMSLWDVRLNIASLVIMILSVGFSVDYSAHIAEGFMLARGKGLDCGKAVENAVSEMGVSVMNGGISTLLAVLMLSISKSEGFRVLFKMFLGMVCFGLLHGLVLLPAMFLVCGAGGGSSGAVVAQAADKRDEKK
jgi:predicted RND superfamily exporter protein